MSTNSELLGKVIKSYDKIILRHLETGNYINIDDKVDLQPPYKDEFAKAL